MKVDNSRQKQWAIIIVDIIDRKQPNYVRKMNILELYKTVTLAYYYSGALLLFTNINQITTVESGFGHFQSLNSPTDSQLEMMCDNKNILCTSSVNTDLMFPACVEEDVLSTKGNSYIMSKVNNASSCDFLWETYITMEFEKIFNGSTNIRNMPMFIGINDFPTFMRSLKIVRSPLK
ncbi:hypothetical protein C1646_754908 [Rhizophagus diaphanus]|nr:hypothetical protein C1646_754908 [Rhizophagus diaphanus] [Rhizophagus sp. MUCL 43196]